MNINIAVLSEWEFESSEVNEFIEFYSIVCLAWYVAFSLVSIQCDISVIQETNFVSRTTSKTPTNNITQAHIHFDVHGTVHHDKFLTENQLDALISQIYFWNETLHVLDSSSVHHQEFFTVHTAIVYVIQIC